MKTTIPKLRRMVRKVITEMYSFPDPELEQDFEEYPTGTEFCGEVVLRIDPDDWPNFDKVKFQEFCEEFGGCTIGRDINRDSNAPSGLIRIYGSFDALWNGWVNCCVDDPYEFMDCVIQGEENCPSLP